MSTGFLIFSPETARALSAQPETAGTTQAHAGTETLADLHQKIRRQPVSAPAGEYGLSERSEFPVFSDSLGAERADDG